MMTWIQCSDRSFIHRYHITMGTTTIALPPVINTSAIAIVDELMIHLMTQLTPLYATLMDE